MPIYLKVLTIIPISSIKNWSPWYIYLAMEGTLAASRRSGCRGSVPTQNACSQGQLWPRGTLLSRPMQTLEPGLLLSHQNHTELWLGLPQVAAPITSQPGCGPDHGPVDLGLNSCPPGDILVWSQQCFHGPTWPSQPGLTLVTLYWPKPNFAALWL